MTYQTRCLHLVWLLKEKPFSPTFLNQVHFRANGSSNQETLQAFWMRVKRKFQFYYDARTQKPRIAHWIIPRYVVTRQMMD
uniref:Uncharacterized protein n=1 Tax=Heterorhabditis bacteriophora TaxID=37862 RepID=A0A1I7W8N2_HETBA